MRKASRQASIHTKTDPEEIRADLRKICAKRERGDLTEKAFQRVWTERTIDLFRTLVRRRLARDEIIVQEHHIVRAHFKMTQSFLKEPEQLSTSLFATDRRIIRLRAMVKANQPVKGDEAEGTRIDEINYGDVASLKRRFALRPGEAAAGLVIAAIGYLGGPWLMITSKFMIGLGILGMIHALIMPTRWIEIVPFAAGTDPDPILIYLLRRKSARRLVKYVRARTHHG